MEEINLAAVYGSLRKEMHNNHVLGDSKLIGIFNTNPVYTMYNVSGAYPGIKKGGSTSIVMEVYEVSNDVKSKLNTLEGYSETSSPLNNYYNRIVIDTPYGSAYTYLFNDSIANLNIVESGDWLVEKTKIKQKKEINIYSEWD